MITVYYSSDIDEWYTRSVHYYNNIVLLQVLYIFLKFYKKKSKEKY